MTAIELRGVRKEFGDVTAVRDLDLTVQEGEVYGFLGPNGAGKSTTIDMLLDLVRPTAGTVRVLGRDATTDGVAIRQRTGVLPDGFSVYDRLSGREHVEFAVRSKEADDDPDALLERVGLLGDADRKAGGYSKGMRQRLALAMALVDDPDLLVLDEPSSGLDPAGAKEMREIVQREADRGATVFFSSHILEQVDAVCDRVGILRDGELVAEDSVEGLREAVGGEETLEISVGGADGADDAAVEAADFLQPMVVEDESVIARPTGATDTGIDDFLAGNAPMFYAGSWQVPRLQDSDIDWQFIPFPSGPQISDDVSHTWSAGVFYMAPARGGANQEIGQQWIEYIASEEVQARVTDKMGGFPALSSAYETDTFQSTIENEPRLETVEQEIENTKPFPSHPEVPTMWNSVHTQAEALWQGDDIQTVLDRAASEINNVL